MISFPNAKINIGLNIIEKRPDNYHNIETIFYPIPLNDALEISPNDDISFNIIGSFSDCATTEDNLIYKAYKAVAANHTIPPFSCYLKKHIPTGAGLGGGSSDAAFMIKLINDFANLNLSNQQMEHLASSIGADCPFFIQNKPTFAEGIGDKFTNINLNLQGYKLLLIKPNIHVPTKDAYSNTIPHKWDNPIINAISQPINEWNNYIFNDFENSIFPKHPELKHIKQQIYNSGALYASMSGSGSSIYGIFPPNTQQPDLQLTNIESQYYLSL